MSTSPKGRLDMFSMFGFAPIEIAEERLPFVMRSLTNVSDKEVQDIQDSLIRACSGICGYKSAGGFVLVSGSESNRTAMYLAKKTTGKNAVLATNLSHSSIKNAAKELGMKIILVDVDPELGFKVNPKRLEQIIEQNKDEIALVVTTQGTTQLGHFESLSDYPSTENYWIHSDAAYGGMVGGLTGQKIVAKGSRSITIDPHKFVGVLGCGLLLLPNPDDEKLIGNEVSYFRGRATALGTTRSAYPATVALSTMKMLGGEGLERLAKDCIEKAKRAEQLFREGGLKTIIPVQTGIVPIKLNSENEVRYVQTDLERKGYLVSPIEIRGTDSKNKPYQVYGIRMTVTPKPEMTQENIEKFCKATIESYRNMKLIS